MATAKHAYRGTMKALQELGLKRGGHVETVDEFANRIQTEPTPLPSSPVFSTNHAILEVDPSRVCNWELHDRPENELGDLEALAQDLSDNGQAQPCIVRPYTKNTDFDYELIAGERRWRAATIRGLKLKIIVENLNDQQAAIYQIAENGNRQDLSDYAKGMSYYKLIERKIITQKDLEKSLGKNKIEISRLLSFGDIPKQIWDAVGDMTKISARTASEMRAIVNKGDSHYDAVLQLAARLRTGKLGAASLSKEVDKLISGTSLSALNAKTEVRTSSGRHLFTWRKDSNGNISISFPKDIRSYIDKNGLEQALRNEIHEQLTEIDKRRGLDMQVKEESFHMETQADEAE